MNKFLAVVRHEYKKIVLKWSFLIGTLLLPFLALVFTFVPMIIFSIQGEPTRIAVYDPKGTIISRLEKNLSPDRLAEMAKKASRDVLVEIDASSEEKMRRNAAQFLQNFRLSRYEGSGTVDEVRQDLLEQIRQGRIDAYLIVPETIDRADARFEFRSRRAGDFISNDTFKNALNNAVRSQRLAEANISEEHVDNLSAAANIDAKGIDETGAEKSSEGTWIASFVIGLMIYITLAIYGQQILGAVVEEKETRIAEILFSSARPFELLFGKLVGVGLAGLTQLGIWVITIAAFLGFVAVQADLSMFLDKVPTITPLMVAYFLIFFLLGFFIYASIFALIGSMVTTVQEGGQFTFPPMMIMLAAFYFTFAVIRDPNSSISFWSTIAPFMAPITMPVRILAEMPPFWHIALSITVNVAAIGLLVWIAARVYRIGMLMYGKRATIPEVLKWIRQA
ncbi:MAG TPA: ABC transporter permease [Pyrinomonadaceae bacterium]|nr:ABC transporter permease [Pyrinomonadaceae bacterium]